jgi:hypothetical protein
MLHAYISLNMKCLTPRHNLQCVLYATRDNTAQGALSTIPYSTKGISLSTIPYSTNGLSVSTIPYSTLGLSLSTIPRGL